MNHKLNNSDKWFYQTLTTVFIMTIIFLFIAAIPVVIYGYVKQEYSTRVLEKEINEQKYETNDIHRDQFFTEPQDKKINCLVITKKED